MDNSEEHRAKSSAEYKVVLSCHDRLVIALSNDPITISGVLLANGIISEETSAQMLLHFATPREKTTILVNNVRESIKINPRIYYDFVNILSRETWTTDIVDILHSTLRGMTIQTKAYKAHTPRASAFKQLQC